MLFFATILTMSFFLNDGYAKRFGGGRSFGVQRSVSSYSRARPNATPLAQPGSKANRWLGPIAGLITGGLLASLFMGHGLGGGIMSWLILAMIGFVIINYLRHRKSLANPSATSAYRTFEAEPVNQYNNDNTNQYDRNNAFMHSNVNSDYPQGFDADTFLREAKVKFIRLQAAYDQKNLNDIRQFTSPEVYAEIQMQFNERGQENNHTEVISLNAELLDAGTEPAYMSNSNQPVAIASVRFTGLIKEEEQGIPQNLNETWHFRQESMNHWIVTGLQQA